MHRSIENTWQIITELRYSKHRKLLFRVYKKYNSAHSPQVAGRLPYPTHSDFEYTWHPYEESVKQGALEHEFYNFGTTCVTCISEYESMREHSCDRVAMVEWRWSSCSDEGWSEMIHEEHTVHDTRSINRSLLDHLDPQQREIQYAPSTQREPTLNTPTWTKDK